MEETETKESAPDKEDKPAEESADKTSEETASEAPNSLFEKTIVMVKKGEAANKKTEELLKRLEKLASDQLLGGSSGGHIESKPKEETPKEYRERIEKEIQEGKHDD